jgi:type III secretory pathway component EscU
MVRNGFIPLKANRKRMSDEGLSPGVMAIEAHEEFVQHIENGEFRIRVLSIISVIVAGFLIASYFSQLLLPYVSDTRVVTVNLLDPGLVLTQLVVLAVASAWLYVGITDYLFARRLGKQVREIRAAEKELEKKIMGAA